MENQKISYHDNQLYCSYNDLVKILGRPTGKYNGSKFTWEITDKKGIIYHIYDYKKFLWTGKTVNEYGNIKICWNIGTNTKKNSTYIYNLFIEKFPNWGIKPEKYYVGWTQYELDKLKSYKNKVAKFNYKCKLFKEKVLENYNVKLSDKQVSEILLYGYEQL